MMKICLGCLGTVSALSRLQVVEELGPVSLSQHLYLNFTWEIVGM